MRTLVQLNRRPDVKARAGPSASPKLPQDRQNADEPNRFHFEFSRIPIYPSAPSAVHPRLAIGSLSDPAEQEADRLSEQVAAPHRQSPYARNEGSLAEQKQQLSQTGSRVSEEIAAPPAVAESLLSPGRSLDSETRAFMEPRFGCDFRHVRIHADDKAAESSRTLDARAYTVGHNIVFAAGHYAPHTLSGKKLLAHELTHVVQQRPEPVPVVRRSPKLDALHKYTTKQKVWDSDAKAIDLAITQSPTISKFPPKKAKQARGNVDTQDKDVFASQYTTYAKGLKEKPAEIQEDLKTVAGFTDRSAGKIHILNRVANVEVLLHEAIHLNSQPQFQNNFGHHLNEGVTEHFTQAVLKEQGLDPGAAYPDELAMADALISDLGENLVGQAYFQGKMDAYRRVLDALSRDKDRSAFSRWHEHATGADHKGWKEATTQLHAALSAR